MLLPPGWGGTIGYALDRHALVGTHPQVLNVDVDRDDRHAERPLDRVFDAALDVASYFGNSGAMLDDDVQIDDDLVIIQLHVYTTTVAGRMPAIRLGPIASNKRVPLVTTA